MTVPRRRVHWAELVVLKKRVLWTKFLNRARYDSETDSSDYLVYY